LATFEGVKRTGPPVAVQKLRDDFYMVHVAISESPSADWKRLFYDTQQAPPPDFLPRAVEISGALLKFRTESANVEARLGWIDKWIERANQKESAMSGRMDEERRRKREELAHEQKELNEINDRWAKL
jgi:hypothetical protein